jgi:acetyl esterase
MPLDPEILPILELFEQLGMPDPATARPEDFRESMAAIPVENPTAVGAVEDRNIAGADGKIKLRIYTPAGEGPWPLLLYFHGGGWVIGDLDSHDETCRQFCAAVAAVVVSVDYHLAPETKFPGPLEDCYAATRWAAEHATELGGDAARLCVAGDSAGGNLAAAVSLLARERQGPAIRHQLLIYPVTDHTCSTPSYRDNGEGYFLTAAMMQWFWGHYLTDSEQGKDPLASPLLADLTALPSATVITAEYDPLRDEGIAYAEALAAAGVPVAQRTYQGMIHGFVSMPLGLTQTGLAMDYLCQRAREALH